jgi:hypothetical protein
MTSSRSSLGQTCGTLLGPIIRIMWAAGANKSDLAEAFQRELATCRGNQRKRVQLLDHDKNIEEVIRQWRCDPRFSDSGAPKSLRTRGRDSEFARLVRGVSEALRPASVMKRLESLRVARRDRRGQVRLIRQFLPFRYGRSMNLDLAVLITSDYLRALEVDLLWGRRPGRAIFLRAAQNYHVDRRAFREFDRFVRDQGGLLLESVEDWLGRRIIRSRQSNTKRNTRTARLGLGMYVINDSYR